MAHYRAVLASERGESDTFDYLADFANTAAWDPGVLTARRSDPGPLGQGSRFQLELRVGPRVVPVEYRIEAYRRPHRLVLVGEGDSFRSEDTVHVSALAGGGSLVDYRVDLQMKGRWSAVQPVAGALLGPMGDRSLRGLRQQLSADPPGGSAPAGELAARVVDELLEASVVGSFSRLGPQIRGRLAGWARPPALSGRVVLITGATSGLGLAAAIACAELGATVRFVARDATRAEAAAATMRASVRGADVSFLIADLGEPEQVRAVAAEFGQAHPRLDVLIHNAGALTPQYTATAAGLEVTVATQLVSPFLLTGLLLPQLRAATPSRVIQVCSGGMYTQRFDLASLVAGPERYDGTRTYARVKRAQLVLIHEWSRRLDGSGLFFHAMHPGWADTPGVEASLPGFHRVMGPLLRSAEEGADTMVWLASSPEGVTAPSRLWLDRRPRWEHKVPWTRLGHDEFVRAGSALWSWCAERAGWDGVPGPANLGGVG